MACSAEQLTAVLVDGSPLKGDNIMKYFIEKADNESPENPASVYSDKSIYYLYFDDNTTEELGVFRGYGKLDKQPASFVGLSEQPRFPSNIPRVKYLIFTGKDQVLNYYLQKATLYVCNAPASKSWFSFGGKKNRKSASRKRRRSKNRRTKRKTLRR